MNAPVIFYHLWPTGEWKRVNNKIFTKIVSSGLSSIMGKMYICVNSDIEFSSIELFGIDPLKVEFIRTTDTQSEWSTLQILYEKYSKQENTPILYLHCKGARFVTRDNNYHSINSWVDGMTYFNVVRWKKCIGYLNSGKTSVGIRAARLPVSHYSGNFWWINSSGLKLLLDPKTQEQSFKNRHGAEFWIGRLGFNNLFDMDMDRNLFTYNRIVDPSLYMEKDKSEKAICIHRVGNQDVAWANRTGLEYEVFQKSNNLVTDSRVEAYIQYIYDNYEELPKYIFFLSALAIVNVYNLIPILKNSYKRFQPLGKDKFRDNYEGIPNHPNLPIEDVWDSMFSTQCPEYFSFTSNSNFGVSSVELLQYSKEFYKNILDNVKSGNITIIDCCFERIWETMFAKKHPEARIASTVTEKLFDNEPNISFFTLGNIRQEYIDVDPIVLGDNKLEYWNTILTTINDSKNTKLVFLSDSVNYSELKTLVEFNFKLNNRVSSQYLEFSFSNWNAIVIDREILAKNKNKKKTFIDPFLDTLAKKLLHFSDGT